MFIRSWWFVVAPHSMALVSPCSCWYRAGAGLGVFILVVDVCLFTAVFVEVVGGTTAVHTLVGGVVGWLGVGHDGGAVAATVVRVVVG